MAWLRSRGALRLFGNEQAGGVKARGKINVQIVGKLQDRDDRHAGRNLVARQVTGVVIINAVAIGTVLVIVCLGGGTVAVMRIRRHGRRFGIGGGLAKKMRHRRGYTLYGHHQQQCEYQYFVDESEHERDSRVNEVHLATPKQRQQIA